MRPVGAALMWLVTTLLLAAALPAMWAQQHLIDRTGYAALAQRAAADPQLQSAVATELTTQVGRIAAVSDASVVGALARTYTSSRSFPRQFAQANDFAHQWLFTDAGVDPQGPQVSRAGFIDVAPMLADPAFAQTLREYNVTLPATVPVTLTDSPAPWLQPGSLRALGIWGPWLSWTLAVLTAAAALLTLVITRRRGRMLTALGVSALLVGATGWAAIAYAQRAVAAALENTTGNPRRIADVMVDTAQTGMQQWLNVTLVVGGGLVIVGVIVTLLTGLTRGSGAGTQTPVRI